MEKQCDIEELKKLVHYEPDTGKLYWKHRDVSMFSGAKYQMRQCNAWNTKNAGKEIRQSDRRYITLSISRKRYKVHRVIWAFHYGEWPKQTLDHINGNTYDNRIVNLRDVSVKENSRNRSISSNNKSGYMGVSLYERTKKWVAHIKVDGKKIHLGYFSTVDDAIAARKAAEIQYGFHENHGRA